MKRFIKVPLVTLAVIIGIWLALVLVSRIMESPNPAKPFVKQLRPFTIAGHRGASMEFAPNTMEAFRRLVEIDPNAMIELDVWPTKDGEVVVFHDALMEVSSNGKGPVPSHTLAEVRALEAGYSVTVDGGKTYPFRGKGCRIPTLDQVLRAFPNSLVSIDIKHPENGFAEKVMAVVQDRGMMDRVVIGSFSDDMVRFIRARYPRVAITMGSSDVKRFLVLQMLCLPGFFRSTCDVFMVPQFSNTDLPEELPGGVSQGFRVITKGFIDSARRIGYPVLAWTINRRENMERLVAMGIGGIITDDPALLKEIVDRREKGL